MEPTQEERRAISAMKRLASKWPKTLWLFSASGDLCVMRCGTNGERVYTADGGVDSAYKLDQVDIPNDGGDW